MKANSSIAVFLAVAIAFTFIGNILTAHIVLSSYERGVSSHTPYRSSSRELDHVFDCNDVHPRNPTLLCPLGKDTSPEYHKAMLSSYDNVLHTNTFHKCSNLHLPLTPHDPLECWPRLIILPSHATSGNELFQYLMDRVFSNADISMSQYHEYPTRKDPLFRLTNNPRDMWTAANSNASNYGILSGLWGTLDTSAAIPFLQRPIIFKSHVSQSDDSARRKEVARPLIQADRSGLLRGVIRMARNPGDQILRNSFRWLSKQCYSDGDECFFKNAHVCCEDLVNNTSTYRAFHSFWNDIQLDASQIIVHYEHIASKTSVSGVIQSVLQFLDSVAPSVNCSTSNQNEMMNRARNVIREPQYTHGTLVARICGREVARMVHDVTKEYSVPLGYVFDDSTGFWALKEMQKNLL